jgi:hypothetical protein
MMYDSMMMMEHIYWAALSGADKSPPRNFEL